MSANVGDRIRMHSNSVDAPDRTGTIVAVLGEDGPPYRVRFDSGEETIVTPGADATIEPPTWSEKIDQVTEQVGEKAGEATAVAKEKAREKADEARESAQKAAGDAARSVAEAAEKIARRFDR